MDYFWSHVEGRALAREHDCRFCSEEAGKAEVTQLDLASIADQDVLGFHVAVDDAGVMQILEGTQQLDCNGSDSRLIQGFVICQNLEQIPCKDELALFCTSRFKKSQACCESACL